MQLMKGGGVCFGLEIRQVSNTDRYDGKVLSMLDISLSALNCAVLFVPHE
jgi:hypothetical protein